MNSLLDLRLQVDDLRRRLDGPAPRAVAAFPDNTRSEKAEVVVGHVSDAGAPARPDVIVDVVPSRSGEVIYEEGMKMADVERAAIAAALKATRGNRRRAAETLGIGERTLYRKLKEYHLDIPE